MPHKWIVGSFSSEDKLLAAVRTARKTGMPVHDVYTPFPVHGMDDALGLAPSKLGKTCFLLGAAGLILAFCFEYWVSVFNWPMNIGGKSFNASPALLPVAFEVTVLFAGLGTVLTFFQMRRLSPKKKADFGDLGACDDNFLLVLKEGPAGAGLKEMRRFLQEQGAVSICEHRGPP